MKHTKGPWKAVRESESFDGSSYLEPRDEQERVEFQAQPFVRIVNVENKKVTTNHDLFVFNNPADAHLIAAAPELLAMLEHVVSTWSPPEVETGIGMFPDTEAYGEISKLIQRAKGG